jgi:hypothetical protein
MTCATTRRFRCCLALWAGVLTSTGAMARPDVPGNDLFTFDVGDVVDTFDSEHFRIHFTTAGTHQVPAADVDDDGVADHVTRLAAIYESALGAYALLGFLGPVSDDGLPGNGGDGRFDVYLVDFARSADGAYRAERCDGEVCSGYMVQENDFAGYGYPSVDVGNRTVASHELFHAVQAAYAVDQGAVFSEGTAVWASERFDPTLRDLEGFAYGYLDNAATPLDSGRGGPVDAFTYGAGIFFEYLGERFDDDVMLELWQHVGASADVFWFSEVDAVLASRDSTFAEAFAEFSSWTLLTGRRADAARSFTNGSQMDEREGLPRTLPIEEASFVLFTSSSRLLSASLNGRSEVQVGLVGAATATDGVRVFVLPLSNGRAGALVDATDGAAVAVAGANEVLVLAVNTRAEGSSARPRLCVGDADEVAACATSAEGEGEGKGEDEAVDDDEGQSGGGCAQAETSSPSPSFLSLSLLLSLLWGRRRGSEASSAAPTKRSDHVLGAAPLA